MKLMKKIPLIPIILGIILMVYALVSWFVQKSPFDLNLVVGKIVIGLGLLAFAFFILLPKITSRQSKVASTLRIIEFAVIVVAAFIGFILPAFKIDLGNIGNGSLWVGIALVLSGGVELYLGTHGKVSNRNGAFFISLISVILGTWIYARNLIDPKIKVITFLTLMIGGAALTLYGSVIMSKKPKSKRN